MNPHIESIYTSRQVTGKSGAKHALHSAIDRDEGAFIHRIISDDPAISKTLEIGCAYGLSSLHICDAIRSRPGARHTIIDPFQNEQWDGVGIRNLKESGVDFFDLIEERSEFALAELTRAGEGRLDFVFIDGWHTFDHTMLDSYYATRLLKVGGYLVLDDVTLAPVRKAVDYLRSYPCYQQISQLGKPNTRSYKLRIAEKVLRLIPTHQRERMFSLQFLHDAFDTQEVRMVALKKVSKDERDWDWYKSF
jgi:predicted O-methyltransferase YrrM